MMLFKETKEITCSFILRCLTMRFKSSSLCQPIVIRLKKKNMIQFNKEIISCHYANFLSLDLILFLLYIFQIIHSFSQRSRCKHFQVPDLCLTHIKLLNANIRHILRTDCSKMAPIQFLLIKRPNPYSLPTCKNV